MKRKKNHKRGAHFPSGMRLTKPWRPIELSSSEKTYMTDFFKLLADPENKAGAGLQWPASADSLPSDELETVKRLLGAAALSLRRRGKFGQMIYVPLNDGSVMTERIPVFTIDQHQRDVDIRWYRESWCALRSLNPKTVFVCWKLRYTSTQKIFICIAVFPRVGKEWVAELPYKEDPVEVDSEVLIKDMYQGAHRLPLPWESEGSAKPEVPPFINVDDPTEHAAIGRAIATCNDIDEAKDLLCRVSEFVCCANKKFVQTQDQNIVRRAMELAFRFDRRMGELLINAQAAGDRIFCEELVSVEGISEEQALFMARLPEDSFQECIAVGTYAMVKEISADASIN